MRREITSPATAREILEERVEYSNVTSLRESLLPIVERLRNEPSVRYLIFKHGQPEAVLMSFQTYELLKRAVNEVLAAADEMSREQAIEKAIARLHAEPQRPESAPVRSTIADNDEGAASAEEMSR